MSAGDVVLLRAEETHCSDWPLGCVKEAIESDDGKRRKAQEEVWKDGSKKIFLRPIKELALLVAAEIPKDSSCATTD